MLFAVLYLNTLVSNLRKLVYALQLADDCKNQASDLWQILHHLLPQPLLEINGHAYLCLCRCFKMEQFTALCIMTVFLKWCLLRGWGEGRITPSFGSNSPLIDLISPIASCRSSKKKGFKKKKDILCINHLVYPNHKETWKMEMVGRITCHCFLS